MPTRILYTLVPAFFFCLPLAVAGQNIISALFLLSFGGACIQDAKLRRAFKKTAQKYRTYLFSALAYIAWMTLSGFMNGKNPDFDFSKFSAGYLGWIVLPLFAASLAEWGYRPHLKTLGRALITIALVWVAIVVSQSFLGWRILDGRIADDILRPRGLYSHPLTLAYVGLVVYLGCDLLRFLIPKQNPNTLILWVFGISGLVVSILSQSRMTQLCILLFSALQIFLRLSGRKRAIAAAAMLALLAGVVITDNPISSRFKGTFTDESFDRQSDYPDDRLAFWHVHWEMIKERPIVGHGPHIHTAYRTPYYEKLGLADFKKKYEAHNTFIQIFTGGGAIGFFLFMLFCVLQWRTITSNLDKQQRRHAYVVAGFIAFASLAQNSLQDAEVRFSYTVLLATIAYMNANHYFLKKMRS